MRTTLALLALLGATGCSDSTPAADSGAHIRETAPPCTIADYATVAGCAQVVGQSFTCLPADHLPETDAGISYSENPPSSGPHWPFWEQTWGEHSDVVPRERWVHNLEHGGVILLYNCPQGCDAELAVLRVYDWIEDARRRSRPDLAEKYTHRLADLVQNASYSETIERKKSGLKL